MAELRAAYNHATNLLAYMEGADQEKDTYSVAGEIPFGEFTSRVVESLDPTEPIDLEYLIRMSAAFARLRAFYAKMIKSTGGEVSYDYRLTGVVLANLFAASHALLKAGRPIGDVERITDAEIKASIAEMKRISLAAVCNRPANIFPLLWTSQTPSGPFPTIPRPGSCSATSPPCWATPRR